MKDRAMEKYIEAEATSREKAAVDFAVAILEPRNEYAEGRLKLDVILSLPDGNVLEAKEDEEGLAGIAIQKADGTRIDLARFLPTGYRFVTPTFFIKNQMLTTKDNSRELGNWFIVTKDSLKFIAIGDLRDPRETFTLLHEIGHASAGDGRNFAPWGHLNEEVGRIFSRQERGAWRWALLTARKLKRENNIDLLDLFEDWNEFKKFLYGCLLTHRYAIESDKVDFARLLMRNAEVEYLKNLFDKGKLSK